jgi:hypothetical protein
MKINSCVVGVTLVASLLFTQGCWSGPADMQRIADTLDGGQKYESMMRRFLIRGRYGDLDGMLALISKTTIELAGGREKVRELLKNDTMPALMRFTDLESGGSSMPGKDQYGHPGWIFKETLISADGNRLKMEFSVIREDDKSTGEIGKLGVAYFGPWK